MICHFCMQHIIIFTCYISQIKWVSKIFKFFTAKYHMKENNVIAYIFFEDRLNVDTYRNIHIVLIHICIEGVAIYIN